MENSNVKKDIKKEFLYKIFLIIAIIVAINFISLRIFTRLDLTKNKTYTLSDASKEIVKQLEDNFEIRAYFSNDLPYPFNTIKQDVKDFLSDYRSYSNGKINYVFISPSDDDQNNEVFKEAQKFGIQPFPVGSKAKQEIRNVLMGLVVLYQGKTETIQLTRNTVTGQVVPTVADLEYELTSIIKKLATEKKKKIGFLTGHDEYEYSKMNTISNAMNRYYDVVNINLSSNTPISEDVYVLVVFGPKREIPDWQRYLIDQYIMRGGNVLWLIDKIYPNYQQQMTIGNVFELGLDSMLLNYGIKINNDLLRDLQCAQVSVQTSIGIPLPMSYPFFPVVTNINKDINAFKNIEYVTLQFASTLDLKAAETIGIKAIPILKSSQKAGVATGFFILNIEQFQNLTRSKADSIFNQGDFVLAAEYIGKFKSYYDGKEVPKDTTPNSTPPNIQQKNQCDRDVRMIVVTDADFANEEKRPGPENINFFLNLVDYLADDVGLSEIRSKMTSETPINEAELSPAKKTFIKYFDLIFPPIVVLLLGLYIWNRKKARRKKMQEN